MAVNFRPSFPEHLLCCRFLTKSIALAVVWSFPVSWMAAAADFTGSSTFTSVEAFAAGAKAFQPASSKSDLAKLFVVRESEQSENPRVGKPFVAPAIAACDVIWSGETHALVFATAVPPTESTHSAVGVLFLLVSSHGQWHISDRLQFLATGKYAEVKCELTSGTGVGYHLGTEGHRPIVTITEQQGGRGYTYLVSASYTYAATNLKRLNLE